MENTEPRMLDREEQLVRLLELTNSLGVVRASQLQGPLTPQLQHAKETGHLLSFGCCKAA